MLNDWVIPLLLAFVAALMTGTAFFACKRSRGAAAGVAIVTFVLLFAAALGYARRGTTTVRIVAPAEGAEVSQRTVVRGTVSRNARDVVVLVRPLGNEQWWVQDRVVRNEEGVWQVLAYFGTERIGVGERYAIVAIAFGRSGREPALRPGQLVRDVPQARARSDVVFVQRTR